MWRTICDIVGNVYTDDMGNIPTPRHHFETPDVTAPQKERQGEARLCEVILPFFVQKVGLKK
jgi:hypothetical protein